MENVTRSAAGWLRHCASSPVSQSKTEFNAGSSPADFKVAHYPFFAALIFAQRARCAAAILFLPAADILRVGRAVLFRADLFPVVRVPSNNRST